MRWLGRPVHLLFKFFSVFVKSRLIHSVNCQYSSYKLFQLKGTHLGPSSAADICNFEMRICFGDGRQLGVDTVYLTLFFSTRLIIVALIFRPLQFSRCWELTAVLHAILVLRRKKPKTGFRSWRRVACF